jgi:hypothetical protein
MQLEGDFEQPLFWGGPVEGPLMALHDSLALAEMQVLPGVFFSMQRQNIQALLERKTRSAGFSPVTLVGERTARG